MSDRRSSSPRSTRRWRRDRGALCTAGHMVLTTRGTTAGRRRATRIPEVNGDHSSSSRCTSRAAAGRRHRDECNCAATSRRWRSLRCRACSAAPALHRDHAAVSGRANPGVPSLDILGSASRSSGWDRRSRWSFASCSSIGRRRYRDGAHRDQRPRQSGVRWNTVTPCACREVLQCANWARPGPPTMGGGGRDLLRSPARRGRRSLSAPRTTDPARRVLDSGRGMTVVVGRSARIPCSLRLVALAQHDPWRGRRLDPECGAAVLARRASGPVIVVKFAARRSATPRPPARRGIVRGRMDRQPSSSSRHGGRDHEVEPRRPVGARDLIGAAASCRRSCGTAISRPPSHCWARRWRRRE